MNHLDLVILPFFFFQIVHSPWNTLNKRRLVSHVVLNVILGELMSWHPGRHTGLSTEACRVTSHWNHCIINLGEKSHQLLRHETGLFVRWDNEIMFVAHLEHFGKTEFTVFCLVPQQLPRSSVWFGSTAGLIQDRTPFTHENERLSIMLWLNGGCRGWDHGPKNKCIKVI